MDMDRLLVVHVFGNDHRYLSVISPEEDFSDRVYADLYFLSTNAHISFTSCDGLLCFNSSDGRVVLCNPNTRRLKFLPLAQRPPNLFRKIFNCCGFGYDPASDDYKVIRNYDLVEVDEYGSFRGAVTKFELYSCTTDCWNEITAPSGPDFNICRGYGCVFIDGRIHWIVVYGGANTEGVLAFDVATETFSSFALPAFVSNTFFLLVEINRSLGVILYDGVGLYKSFSIWQWTKEGWARLFDDVLFDVKIPLGLKDDRFLFVEREHDSELSHLLVYDLTTGEMRETEVFDYPNKMRIVSHHESTCELPNEMSMSIYDNEETWNEFWNRFEAGGNNDDYD